MAGHPVSRILAIAPLCLLLAACMKPTAFAPATADQPYGYSDTVIDDDTVRIEVSGNSDTPRTLVENQLLYRAAQLALERGESSFIFLTRETDRRVEFWPRGSAFGYPFSPYFGPYYGTGYFGPYGFGRVPLAYAGGGLREVDRFTAFAEARFFTGDTDDFLGPAYDAVEVEENLRDKVNLPEQAAKG
ncbi:MAG: hypothetical protein AAFY02_17370 [Pseudomonadota bacterium]